MGKDFLIFRSRLAVFLLHPEQPSAAAPEEVCRGGQRWYPETQQVWTGHRSS